MRPETSFGSRTDVGGCRVQSTPRRHAAAGEAGTADHRHGSARRDADSRGEHPDDARRLPSAWIRQPRTRAPLTSANDRAQSASKSPGHAATLVDRSRRRSRCSSLSFACAAPPREARAVEIARRAGAGRGAACRARPLPHAAGLLRQAVEVRRPRPRRALLEGRAAEQHAHRARGAERRRTTGSAPTPACTSRPCSGTSRSTGPILPGHHPAPSRRRRSRTGSRC